jgi:hypothetical protein
MALLSGRRGQRKGKIGRAVAALSLGMALVGGASEARAEGPVVGTAKGIIGTAMLGGEAVAIGMAAFGVEKGWTYLVFPPLAAVGGGIGGYFIEQAAPPAEVPLYLLAGGMAFVIPTIIVALNATVYKAPVDYPNEPVQNKPASEPPLPKTSHVPTSLVDVYRGRLAVGVPAVEIRPVYTQEEIAKFGVTQAREVKIPVFQAVF